jgi:fission process protein 1
MATAALSTQVDRVVRDSKRTIHLHNVLRHQRRRRALFTSVRVSKNDKDTDIELFETIGTSKDQTSFEPFSFVDTSEPSSFDGEEKTEYDPLRDGPLRYLGYSNELGEAFSAWLFPGGVQLSYMVAVGYVFFDTYDKYTRTLADADEKLGSLPNNQNLVKTIGFERGVDTLVWQLLASVAIPGYTIHTIVGVSSDALGRTLDQDSQVIQLITRTVGTSPDTVLQLVEKSLPTFIGLAAIPFIVHPIDSAVHGLLNATLRPVLRSYICNKAGGKEAGLPICENCK